MTLVEIKKAVFTSLGARFPNRGFRPYIQTFSKLMNSIRNLPSFIWRSVITFKPPTAHVCLGSITAGPVIGTGSGPRSFWTIVACGLSGKLRPRWLIACSSLWKSRIAFRIAQERLKLTCKVQTYVSCACWQSKTSFFGHHTPTQRIVLGLFHLNALTSAFQL